jgi:hypothetical protein
MPTNAPGLISINPPGLVLGYVYDHNIDSSNQATGGFDHDQERDGVPETGAATPRRSTRTDILG